MQVLWPETLVLPHLFRIYLNLSPGNLFSLLIKSTFAKIRKLNALIKLKAV